MVQQRISATLSEIMSYINREWDGLLSSLTGLPDTDLLATNVIEGTSIIRILGQIIENERQIIAHVQARPQSTTAQLRSLPTSVPPIVPAIIKNRGQDSQALTPQDVLAEMTATHDSLLHNLRGSGFDPGNETIVDLTARLYSKRAAQIREWRLKSSI